MECRKDILIYAAKPKIYDINKYKLVVLSPILSANQNLEFILVGNFLNISNLYLSASNNTIFDNITFFNPFSSVEKLSGKNIPFSGIEVKNFSFTENYLIFNFPYAPKNSGFVDVLVMNEAGYSKMSIETIVKPITACDNTLSFQKPCISGIQIVNNHINI
jgi:hypothetical protein